MVVGIAEPVHDFKAGIEDAEVRFPPSRREPREAQGGETAGTTPLPSGRREPVSEK